MDEKTEELRDLFVDVTGGETVTEEQEEGRGSLASDENVDERLRETVSQMRAQLGFATSLDDETLVEVVRGFYSDDSDADIGRRVDERPKTVARARTDLHLLRDTDTDPPFDFESFREALDETDDTDVLADRFDVSASTVRRYRRVVEAQREIRRVNDRFRDEFENLLQDRELTERLTADAQEDGLDEATEGQEVDVDF
ncbi:conditioned medium-induced protein 4 [Halospeciosus flavus]|uniref:Conditioned medium-induced protein 4 n=1 Tax=Halospeciosus flavus TaxID=3032283 RepID=A0ABD5Z722_9EURY|nr:conditioned medium-induced protein 4 [Halospeciosus flavus]